VFWPSQVFCSAFCVLGFLAAHNPVCGIGFGSGSGSFLFVTWLSAWGYCAIGSTANFSNYLEWPLSDRESGEINMESHAEALNTCLLVS
jgi:hypothetical protein